MQLHDELTRSEWLVQELRNWRYLVLGAGYRFVSMMAMGSILTLWK
jgi:hypothetical protein